VGVDHVWSELHQVLSQDPKLSAIRTTWQHHTDDGHTAFTKLRGDRWFGGVRFEQHHDVHIVAAVQLTSSERVDDPLEATKSSRRENVYELHRFDAIPASLSAKP